MTFKACFCQAFADKIAMSKNEKNCEKNHEKSMKKNEGKVSSRRTRHHAAAFHKTIWAIITIVEEVIILCP